jgi:hypothetical protein
LPAVAVFGCKKEADRTAAADAGRRGEPRRYTVRGEVVRLPARPGDDIFIRHEAIDDFVDSSGQVAPMAAMTMPFRIERAVLGHELAVGDKIEMRFAVDWSVPALQVEHIRKLPAATTLQFGPAPHPAGAAAR